ncbi:MAG: DMT family transporter [Victivallales bacterium]|nr:DMT family transporter [Victivallales bacterium]
MSLSQDQSPSPVSKLGLSLAVLGILCFSTIELTCKALRERIDAVGGTPINGFLMCFLRFFFSGIVLIALFYPAFRHCGRRLKACDWLAFLINGLTCVTISISLYQFSLPYFHNAFSAAVVFSSNALFTIIFARFVNGEPWNVKKWLAMVVGICGILCFFFESGRPDRTISLGLLLMGCSALTFALSVCITRRIVKRYGAGLFMGFSSLIGSMLVIPLALWKYQPGELNSCRSGLLELIIVVVVGTILGYTLYYGSMKYITAYLASMTFLLKPIFACLLACLLAGEKMNAWTVAGTVIIVCSLVVTSLPGDRRKPLSGEDVKPGSK